MSQALGNMNGSLNNSGIAVLNPEKMDLGTSATIIVVGIPRSGTSMVGSALSELGIHLGDEVDKAVFEDVEIAKAMENDDVMFLRSLINRKNECHQVWAFKRPMAYSILPKYLHLFRNPRVIVSFRDPVAIAKRNEISMVHSFLKALDNAANMTKDIVQFSQNIACPALLFSYEKAISDPPAFIEALIGFCGIQADEIQRSAAECSVHNGPETYLTSSRVWYEGGDDGVRDNIARGWVLRMPTKTTCSVEIWSGGNCIGKGHADSLRQDLLEKGACGFEILLSDKIDNGNVEVRVSGTTFVLPKTS